MKYKTSFFNKGVLKNDLKRFSWIGILYLIVLIFVLPFQIIMQHSYNVANPKHQRYMNRMFDYMHNDILPFAMFIVPVIVAIFLFRYIQNKKPVDMIHSLPIKRVNLYDNHVIFGIVTLILPVIITTIISCILKSTLNLNDVDMHFTYKQIWVWCGSTIMFSVLTFLFSVLIGMLTGLSTAQGILTYIFLFFPVGLGMLIISNLQPFLFGLEINFSSITAEKLSPFTRIDNLEKFPLRLTEILIYILLSILIFALARFVYVKRDLEAATNVVAFKKLQPIFKYGVTFCFMLVGGMYFEETQNGIKLIIFGYILASFIGYFLSEMIIKKSIRVFKNVKGYIIYAGIISVIMLCINFDIIGYQKRVPDISEIKSIYLADTFYLNHYDESQYMYPKSYLYYEKDSIENIQNLHENIIKNKELVKNYKGRTESFAIKYNLKNGKEVKREYYLNNEHFKDYLKPLYESKEYKNNNFDILKVNSNVVDKIKISPSNGLKLLTIINPTEIKEVIDILKNVTFNKSYEEMQDSRQDWGTIDLLFSNNKSLNLSFSKTNKELEKWLSSKDYLKNTRIMSEDIEYILVAKRVNGRIDDIVKSDVKKLKITDRSKIEACLQNASDEWRDEYNLQYDMEIMPNNSNAYRFKASFDEKHTPDFVKKYFK